MLATAFNNLGVASIAAGILAPPIVIAAGNGTLWEANPRRVDGGTTVIP